MLRRVGRELIAPGRLGLLALCCALVASCEYDSDDRCGPGQVMRGRLCFCAEGKMLKGNACVDAPMSAAGAPAPAPTSGQGAACTTNAECTEAPYTTCVTKNASSGYCSNTGCSNDCETGYFCATDATPSYCKRNPTGQDDPCTSMADCANKDASFCAMNPAGGSNCVVPDCTTGGCSPTFPVCYDLGMAVPGAPDICVPAS